MLVTADGGVSGDGCPSPVVNLSGAGIVVEVNGLGLGHSKDLSTQMISCHFGKGASVGNACCLAAANAPSASIHSRQTHEGQLRCNRIPSRKSKRAGSEQNGCRRELEFVRLAVKGRVFQWWWVLELA